MGYCPSQDWDRHCRDTDEPEDADPTTEPAIVDIGPEPGDDEDFRLEPPPCVVTLSCSGERVPESSVKFLDISEDIGGRDVLTFECPACGKVHTSLVLG